MKFFFSVRNVAPFALLPALSVTSALKPKKWKKVFGTLYSAKPNERRFYVSPRKTKSERNLLEMPMEERKRNGKERKKTFLVVLI
jgi:hypothetical protein